MKIIQPDVTLNWITPDYLTEIETAARICYASEGNNAERDMIKTVKLLTWIIENGHHSVLEHASASFTIVCDRGVTHELVRHRLASFSQESTRYCNYSEEGKKAAKGMQFVLPTAFELSDEDLDLLSKIEAHYNKRIEDGLKPQDARYFLPNGLRTKIRVTMNFRELRHFFKLRYFEVTGPAQPDMKAIASTMYRYLSSIPVIFKLGMDKL